MATGSDDIKDGRGLAVADFDNDGALDLVVNNNPGAKGRPPIPATLLRNNIGGRRNWLAVELRGTKSNHDAVGAVVLAEIAPDRIPDRPLFRLQRLPPHPRAAAFLVEAEVRPDTPVQVLYGFAEAVLAAHAKVFGKGHVHAASPTGPLKGGEDRFLIGCLIFEVFDDVP